MFILCLMLLKRKCFPKFRLGYAGLWYLRTWQTNKISLEIPMMTSFFPIYDKRKTKSVDLQLYCHYPLQRSGIIFVTNVPTSLPKAPRFLSFLKCTSNVNFVIWPLLSTLWFFWAYFGDPLGRTETYYKMYEFLQLKKSSKFFKCGYLC